MEDEVGIEPTISGFAGRRLTIWLLVRDTIMPIDRDTIMRHNNAYRHTRHYQAGIVKQQHRIIRVIAY